MIKLGFGAAKAAATVDGLADRVDLAGGVARMEFSRRGVLGASVLSLLPLSGAGVNPAAGAPPAAGAAMPAVPAPELELVRGAPAHALPVGSGGVRPEALAAAQAISDQYGGSSLLVWRGGALVYERYAEGFGPQTPLATFSMAKSVLGLMFGLAVAKGVVSLDDQVSRHVEEWRGDPRGAITLRQLMQMRSGLKVYPLSLTNPGAYALLFGRDITKTVLETPLVDTPGEAFEYANVNCFVAGLALDRALSRAGEGRYVEFLSRELWRPLGQSDAMIDVDGPKGVPRFFAGLNAPARDWLRLGLLFVQDGRVNGRQIVPSEWLRSMITPSPNPSYGLFIWIGNPWVPLRSYGPYVKAKAPCKEPFLASDMVYFDGAGGQRVYASANLKLVVVRTGKQALDWDDSALPNAVIRGFV